MGLLKRLVNIVSTNMHDTGIDLDTSAGGADSELRQTIGEMEASLAQARQSTAKAMAHEKLIARQLADSERQVQVLSDQATEAVRAGDDDRARKVLADKAIQEKNAQALRQEHDAVGEASGMLRHQLEAMEASLADAKRSAATVSARHRAAVAKKQAVAPDLDTDPFTKFDRMSEKIDMAEAEAEALAEINQGSDQPPSPAPSQLEASDADIEAELARLKDQTGKS